MFTLSEGDYVSDVIFFSAKLSPKTERNLTEKFSLLAIMVLSPTQSSTWTLIHNAILLIDTSTIFNTTKLIL